MFAEWVLIALLACGACILWIFARNNDDEGGDDE